MSRLTEFFANAILHKAHECAIDTGVWIRWIGTMEWNGGMDWTGMVEWNGTERWNDRGPVSHAHNFVRLHAIVIVVLQLLLL